MANASVEKVKALGLRYGEKVVVGLAAAVCLVCLGMAATQKTIELTPDEVRKAAEAADANLQRRQDAADILSRLEAEGIKNPQFEKMVDEQDKNALVATVFRAPHP